MALTYSPTETIFDFRVAEIAPAQVQGWQERAEFLLDEGRAGAASFQATDEEILREARIGETSVGLSPVRHSAANGRAPFNAPLAGETRYESADAPSLGAGFDRLRSEISGLLDVKTDEIRVFPEAELPAIGNRSGAIPLASSAPLSAYPRPVYERAASPFVDSGEQSRYLHTPSDNPPRPTASLLNQPAPALGKVPAPSLPPVSLTAGQIRFLDEEIAHLYEDVKRVLAARREITGHALSLLREAREILLTEPHRLGRAEHNLAQVRSILERAHESRRQSSRRGLRVLLYLALWLAGTIGGGVALFLYGAELTRMAAALLGSQSRVVAHFPPFLWTLITGSGGAVAGAILGFLAHIRSENDFDRQHVVRFAVQPVMGVVLGVFVYFFFSALFFSMEIDLTARSVTRALPVMLALPAGLWQEWIYASLYRTMGFFTLRPRRR